METTRVAGRSLLLHYRLKYRNADLGTTASELKGPSVLYTGHWHVRYWCRVCFKQNRGAFELVPRSALRYFGRYCSTYAAPGSESERPRRVPQCPPPVFCVRVGGIGGVILNADAHRSSHCAPGLACPVGATSGYPALAALAHWQYPPSFFGPAAGPSALLGH